MRIVVCSSKSWFELKESIKQKHDVTYLKNNDDLSIENLNDIKPDYIFFTHWNWIVKKEIHENFNCILFHTAPLPFGRGGSPIQNLILMGFEKTRVCAIKMTRELDSGPIYAYSNISLTGSLQKIFSRINFAINDLVVEIIKNNPKPVPQVGQVHYFKRLTAKDNEIPIGLRIKEFYDRIRMVDQGDYPNAFITYDDIKIEFMNAELVDNTIEAICVIKKLS